MHKTIKILIVCGLILVMSITINSLFFIVKPVSACHGNITIIKVTEPDSCQEFNFTGNLGSFSLTNGNNKSFYKSGGNYTVTEEITSGWELTAINCTGDDNININLANRTVTIDLDNEEDVVCTFFNTEDVPEPYCGDGIVNQDEECDEGEANGQVCEADYGDNCTYCSSICSLIELTGPYCDDEVINGEEECDDGEAGSDDCTPNCTLVEEEYLTILAYKVVCASEGDLPDWGTSGSQAGEPSVITDSTAQDFIDASQGRCWWEPGWTFQWGYDGEAEKQVGNHIGPAPTGTGWYDFDSATGINSSNPAVVYIGDISSVNKLWVRENLQAGCFPFVNPPGGLQDPISAEMYCYTDILNYDNYEWINNLAFGQTYHCLAFNALVEQEYASVSGCKWNDLNNNGSWEVDETEILAGVEINLSGEAEANTLTNEWGCYEFNGLLPGTYQISETVPAGWLQTYPNNPNYHSVTITGSEHINDLHFGNYQPFCGDGNLDDGEQCDDGNTEDGDGCSSTCQFEAGPYCGDNNLDDGEECDDGNNEDGDGCSSTCTIEEDGPVCGNEILEDGEECDDGNNENGDGCSSTCTIEEIIEPFCGDNNLDDGEECDDGNNEDGDGCSSICTIEEVVEPYCGDGNVDEGEECDDGEEGSTTCTSECTLKEPYCGDEICNGEETCSNCEQDCGTCGGPYCGDGSCNGSETCSNCSSDCGSCGGGDIPLTISNVGFKCTASDTITIVWTTNKPATSRVLYDTVPHNSIGTAPNYGYAYSTEEDATKITSHTVTVAGLTLGTMYYFRPISHGSGEVYGTEVACDPEICSSIEVLGEEGLPILTIEKQVNQEFANPGTQVSYKVTIQNNGNLTAFNTVLTDILPAGFTFIDDGTAEKTWQLGDLESGQSQEIEYQVQIANDVAPAIYANLAQVSADNHDPVNAYVDLEIREVLVLPASGFDKQEYILLIIVSLVLMTIAQVLKRKELKA